MNPTDASIVLTGAAGGLGSAIARKLMDDGACLLLVGRSAPSLLSLAQSLGADFQGRSRVDALVADITTDHGRAAIIDTAAARRANVLINNAAVVEFGPAQDLLSDQARRMIETNLLAPMLLTAGMLPMLCSRDHAHVLNIGSTLGSLGVPGFSAYGASKAALRLYTEALRRELADSSLCIQYYAPRAIDTPFNTPDILAFHRATGSPSDSPETVAREVVRMLRTESPLRFAGTLEALAVRLNGVFPGLLDGAFVKHRRALKTMKISSGASS